MDALFRPEVTGRARRRLEGEVLLATPLSTRLLILLLIAVVVGAVIFACLGSYARKTSVIGWLTPSGGVIRVAAHQGGVIESLAVREGDPVKAGQTVARLRLSDQQDGQDVGAALLGGVQAEAAAASRQFAAANARIAASRASLEASRRMVAADLAEGRGRLDLSEQQQRLADAQLERGRALNAQGVYSQVTVDNLERAALSAAQASSGARSDILLASRNLEDIDAQLRQLPSEAADAEAQAAQAQASLAQKRVGYAAQSGYDLGSPIAGKVLALPAHPGQALAAGQSVAIIGPASGPLYAELYIPSRAVGFVRPGQEVKLMYQAYPYQKFGVGHGVVRSVSPTALAPSEVQIPGLEVKEPVFRALVALDRQGVQAYGAEQKLQAGMLLGADIVLERRSLLRWLLDPIYAVRARR